MAKKVLLIAYQFCPKGQVGTRRWSKFAKYLSREGYEVHVLSAHYPRRDKINWCHDVENNPNIKIHRLPSMVPSFLMKPVRDFWLKVFDRIFSHTLYYLDKAQRWGRVMIPAAIDLIEKEGIRDVILTGAPFTPMGQVVQVKRKIPSIRLIFDFRDPWSTRLPRNTLFQRFCKRQAEKMEKLFLPMAETVFFSTKQFAGQYKDIYPELAGKFEALYNGYDKDDFSHLTKQEESRPFYIIYTGSLIRSRVNALGYIIRALSEIEDDFIHENLRINLYGYNYMPLKFEEADLQKLYDKHVHYRGVVSQHEVFTLLQKHEFCLSINAPEHAHLIGSKTFDYMALGKKIFLMAPPGELADILESKNQYVANYSVAAVKEQLLKMKSDHFKGETHFSKVDIAEFEYSNLTRRLMTFVNKLS